MQIKVLVIIIILTKFYPGWHIQAEGSRWYQANMHICQLKIKEKKGEIMREEIIETVNYLDEDTLKDIQSTFNLAKSTKSHIIKIHFKT